MEILNKKKGDLIIKDNSNIETLEEFAAKNKLEIVTADALNQKSGTIVGSGNEPFIVGKAFGLDELQTSKLLRGNSGIFKLKLRKTVAEDLPNYSNLASKLKPKKEKIFRV